MAGRTHIGDLLRAHRLAGDLTLEALAERTGVSGRAISDIERGVSVGPRRSTVEALAAGLSLDPRSRAEFLTAARTGRWFTGANPEQAEREPRRLVDFSGREAEVEALAALIIDSQDRSVGTPTVVVSGAPGVGKTTVVVEAVHRAGAGGRRRLFADLGGLGGARPNPLQVLQTLLRQIGRSADDVRTTEQAQAVWAEVTADGGVVVILDDATSEAQVRAVLESAGGSVVLVTSRRTLAGLEGARHISLSALSTADSVRFLDETIPLDQRQEGSLHELASLCGHLPLALRVAASRIASRPGWSVEDFARRLRSEDRRVGSLVAGDLAVAPAFAASYDSLSLPMQEMFRTLSLLRGSSFTASHAAAASDIDEDSATDALEELVDLGLVEPLRGHRYRLHDLLRIYARGRLHADVPPDVIATRRCRADRWLLATAGDAGMMFAPMTEGERLAARPGDGFTTSSEARDWLMAEADSWFAAYQWTAADGRHEEIVAATARIQHFGDLWHAWGRWHEFFALAASAAAAVGNAEAEARALIDLAHMHQHETFDFHAALGAARRALEIVHPSGNAALMAETHASIGFSAYHLGELDLAREASERALALSVELGHSEGEVTARGTLALVLLTQDPDAALGELRRIIEVTQSPTTVMSEHYRHITKLNAMGITARTLLVLKRYEDAIVEASALIRVVESADPGDVSSRARGHRHRGFAHLGVGDHVSARRDLVSALELAGKHRPDSWAADIEEALASLPDEGDDA